MSEHQKINARQRAAIESLLVYGEVTAAATACGASPQTVHSWMREPAFQAALRTAEAECLRGISRRLVALGDRAVATFAAILDDPNASPAHRLRAADATLARLLQLKEITDLETRIDVLESDIAASTLAIEGIKNDRN